MTKDQYLSFPSGFFKNIWSQMAPCKYNSSFINIEKTPFTAAKQKTESLCVQVI